MPATTINIEQAVKERYSRAAAAKETALFCVMKSRESVLILSIGASFPSRESKKHIGLTFFPRRALLI